MPTTTNVVRGSIIENAMGNGTIKKIARCCINMFEGNVASYLRVLDSKEQLGSMQELNALTSIIGSIKADNAQDREV
jgi:hypothetical protein